MGVSIDAIEQRVKDAVLNDNVVPISIEIQNPFIDSKKGSGIMSVAAFHHPLPNFKMPNIVYRRQSGQLGGSHIVLVVGVDLDPAGKLIKLKIKNSGGPDAGDQGYFNMYADYFREFLQLAYTPKPIWKPTVKK